jgi:biotin carboxyl carrier protein
MKRAVNGEDVDLPEVAVKISHLPDRLLVHTEVGAFSAAVVRQGDAVLVSYKGRQFKVEPIKRKSSSASSVASGEMRSPMPGTVVAVNVKQGDLVAEGATVLVLEAMKTQQPFIAPFDGIVDKLCVSAGQVVSEGVLLAFLISRTDTLDRVSE